MFRAVKSVGASVTRTRNLGTPSQMVGVDFGNPERAGLPELSVVEQMLISLNVRYLHILKLVGGSSASKGHLITFEHNRRSEIARSLPRRSLQESLQVVFVGRKELHASMLGSVGARGSFVRNHEQLFSVNPSKLLKWLRFLKLANALYWEVRIPDSEAEVAANVTNVSEELLARAVVMDDEETLQSGGSRGR